MSITSFGLVAIAARSGLGCLLAPIKGTAIPVTPVHLAMLVRHSGIET